MTQEAHADTRRAESDATLLLIKNVDSAIKALDKKMTYHHEIFREEVEKSVEKVYVSAFPDGDPTGHRKHHELVIQREEERIAFWHEMRMAAAKWAGLGILGFLGTAVWIAIKTEAHK